MHRGRRADLNRNRNNKPQTTNHQPPITKHLGKEA
jgi:hypothetical protein